MKDLLIFQSPKHKNYVIIADWHHSDEDLLLIGLHEGTLHIYDISEKTMVHSFRPHADRLINAKWINNFEEQSKLSVISCGDDLCLIKSTITEFQTTNETSSLKKTKSKKKKRKPKEKTVVDDSIIENDHSLQYPINISCSISNNDLETNESLDILVDSQICDINDSFYLECLFIFKVSCHFEADFFKNMEFTSDVILRNSYLSDIKDIQNYLMFQINNHLKNNRNDLAVILSIFSGDFTNVVSRLGSRINPWILSLSPFGGYQCWKELALKFSTNSETHWMDSSIFKKPRFLQLYNVILLAIANSPLEVVLKKLCDLKEFKLAICYAKLCSMTQACIVNLINEFAVTFMRNGNHLESAKCYMSIGDLYGAYNCLKLSDNTEIIEQFLKACKFINKHTLLLGNQ